MQEGESNPNSRLSEIDVKLIRKYSEKGYSVKELAADFGVSDVLVYKILSGERWGYLKK